MEPPRSEILTGTMAGPYYIALLHTGEVRFFLWNEQRREWMQVPNPELPS